MSKEVGNAVSTFITKSFDSFKNEWWFKLLIGVVILLFIGGVAFFGIHYAVDRTLNDRLSKEKIDHKDAFERSVNTYKDVKHVLYHSLNESQAEYILLIEYHNGSENVITGIQFCKFDITLEVTADDAEWLNLDKFKDDIIARYDILTSANLDTKELLYYDIHDVKKVDKYLYHLLNVISAKQFAIVDLDKNGLSYGALIYISKTDGPMDQQEMLKCKSRIENIFN